MSLIEVCACAIEMAAKMERRVHELRSLHAPQDLLSRVVLAAEVMERDLAQLLALAGELEGDRTSGVRSHDVDLYNFALDNAVDGCITEHSHFQQLIRDAEDLDEVVMHRLALMIERSKAHTELCWDIHEWCMGQLSPQRGRNIRAAQHVEVGQLAVAEGHAPGEFLGALARRIDRRHRAA